MSNQIVEGQVIEVAWLDVVIEMLSTLRSNGLL